MAHNNSDFIDIKGLLRQYYSKWYLFVISVVVCVLCAFIITKVKKPEYAVRANVLISKDSSPMKKAFGDLGALFGSDGSVDDEIFIITSHSVYRDVAKDLGVNQTYYVKKGFMNTEMAYRNYPISLVAPETLADTLTTGITFKIKVDKHDKADIEMTARRKVVAEAVDVALPYTLESPYGNFVFNKTAYYTDGEGVKTTITYKSYNAAAEFLAREVTSEIAAKRSNVISMAINTPSPSFGQDVLNEVIEKYNERGIMEKNAQGTRTAVFIDERLGLLSADLTKAEAEIQQYKQSHGIIDIEAEAKYQTEKKGVLEGKLLEAETEAEIIRMTSEFLKDPKNAYNLIPVMLPGSGMQDGITAYNELVLRRIELLNNAKGNNTVLKQLDEQIDAMRGNISISIDKALANAEVTVRDIQREKNDAEGRLGNIPTQEREFIDMKRQQMVKQELYLFLLERREETAMMIANAVPKGVIIDAAYTKSEPLGLGRFAMLLLAFFFGLCIPPVWIYLRKVLRNRFDTRQDVERITDVPIIGEMCISNSGHNLVVTSENTSSAAELFRLMRSNLLFILNDPRDKVVLLTSTSSGEGKSFISINLAASLALLNKRVLLVGMDIRNPRIAQYLGTNPAKGLTQYLSSSNVTLEEIIEPSADVEGLDIIVAGPIPPNPAELLTSQRVDELFRQLRTMYDYVIVDTAPIGLVSDTFTLDRIADASIYVCRANYTSLSDLELINEIYEQRRLKKVSLVINGTAAKKSYGYGKKGKK